MVQGLWKVVYEKGKITNAPKEHQKIRVRFVFDVNHSGKFKARLVDDGHLTKEPNETIYSGVGSLRNLRLTMFLAELNDLQLWGADVGNEYLQALIKRSSTLWLAQNLRSYKDMFFLCTRHSMVQDLEEHVGMANSLTFFFKPSKADPDIWMRSSKDGTLYEYIAVYVDDLAIYMKDPKPFVILSRKNICSTSKVLDHSAIILVVDIPQMKMELLLQTQGIMLARFLSPMKKCLGEAKEDQNTISSRRSPRNQLI